MLPLLPVELRNPPTTEAMDDCHNSRYCILFLPEYVLGFVVIGSLGLLDCFLADGLTHLKSVEVDLRVSFMVIVIHEYMM